MWESIKNLFKSAKELIPSRKWMDKPYSQWTEEEKIRFNNEVSEEKHYIRKSYGPATGEVSYCTYSKIWWSCYNEYHIYDERWYPTLEEAQEDKNSRIKDSIINYISVNFSTEIE